MDPFPSDLEPMLATLAHGLPAGDGWAFEVKWDGVRALAFLPPGGPLRFVGRRGTDYTPRYPELAGLAEALGGCGGIVLDGEIVACDEQGRPSFGLLQHRMHLTIPSEIRRRQAEIPVQFAMFDACWLNGTSLVDRTWADRRAVLEGLDVGQDKAWQVPRAQVGGGEELLEATRRAGLEGLVAKRVDSVYEPGRRSRSWLKVKNVRTQEMVIGGWVEGDRGRAGQIGALLIGVYDDDGNLQPAGKVGTGFTQAVLADLQRRLRALAVDESPFARPIPEQRVAHFVRPELVAEVGFGEWTGTGTLRHPRYLGLREDKAAADVRREWEA